MFARNRTMIMMAFAALAMFNFVFATGVASAGIILIDFGISSQTTTGNWNNATAAEAGSNPNNIANLIDNTGASTGISMTYSESAVDAGVSGTGANYSGPYPAIFSTLPESALRDGLFTSSPTITLTFTGLNSGMTYDFLAYGARGNNGALTTYTVNGATSGTGTISNVLNNSTQVISIPGIAPNNLNTITFVVTAPAANSSNAGALNLIQIISVPEPSTLALGLLGLAVYGWRRISATFFL